MANAIGIKIIGQDVDIDDAIRITYDVVFVDLPNGVRESQPVAFKILPDITPQQFRSQFTAAILEAKQQFYPTMNLTENDCIIDVIQRGN